ncbi:hypothetical protein [Nocardioides sp. Kera G14]|uniref:hypothetical protein n=1 Tax=Nocardioides sp. Kera G14 TaxID=2884264 RepID=UPI001D117804|nr:hypothetical protein [Nocardioides sp. Kera G14]UDY23767.1 hypothetical protein LH076_00270 [Nocardioides sp. Kera G14]
MDKILGFYCNFMARMTAKTDDQRGQGTLEYVGMVIVAALIIVAVLNLDLASSIASKLKEKVDDVINH